MVLWALLGVVSALAKASPHLRMNDNFYQSLDDKCHRMLNAVELKLDCIEQFNELLRIGEKYKHKYQYE